MKDVAWRKVKGILIFGITGRHCESRRTENKDKGWKILGSLHHAPQYTLKAELVGRECFWNTGEDMELQEPGSFGSVPEGKNL